MNTDVARTWDWVKSHMRFIVEEATAKVFKTWAIHLGGPFSFPSGSTDSKAAGHEGVSGLAFVPKRSSCVPARHRVGCRTQQ
jgi:hypothetical protein